MYGYVFVSRMLVKLAPGTYIRVGPQVFCNSVLTVLRRRGWISRHYEWLTRVWLTRLKQCITCMIEKSSRQPRLHGSFIVGVMCVFNMLQTVSSVVESGDKIVTPRLPMVYFNKGGDSAKHVLVSKRRVGHGTFRKKSSQPNPLCKRGYRSHRNVTYSTR
jgi:hypothetical protein